MIDLSLIKSISYDSFKYYMTYNVCKINLFAKKGGLKSKRLEEQVAVKVGVIRHSVDCQNDTTKTIKRVMMNLRKDQENAKEHLSKA
jgi:hypothetical protein